MLLARDGGQIDSHSKTDADVRVRDRSQTDRQANRGGRRDVDAEEEAQERRPLDFVRPFGSGKSSELWG